MIKLNYSELNNVVGGGNYFSLGFKSDLNTRKMMVKGLVTGKDSDGSKLGKEERAFAAGQVVADAIPVTIGFLAGAGIVGAVCAIKNRSKGFFKNHFGRK